MKNKINIKRVILMKAEFEICRKPDGMLRMKENQNAQEVEVIPQTKAQENHCAEGGTDQKAEADKDEVFRVLPGRGEL